MDNLLTPISQIASVSEMNPIILDGGSGLSTTDIAVLVVCAALVIYIVSKLINKNKVCNKLCPKNNKEKFDITGLTGGIVDMGCVADIEFDIKYRVVNTDSEGTKTINSDQIVVNCKTVENNATKTEYNTNSPIEICEVVITNISSETCKLEDFSYKFLKADGEIGNSKLFIKTDGNIHLNGITQTVGGQNIYTISNFRGFSGEFTTIS